MKSLVKLDFQDGRLQDVFLQTEYKDDGKSGFKLTLIQGLTVWQGQVTEDDLDTLRLNIKMDMNTFTRQTLQALTKSGDGDIVFNYQLKKKSDDRVELIWKKHIAAEDITFQLGKAVLHECNSPGDVISSVLSHCIDCSQSQRTEISTLQTDNERLSQERVNALKRLEKCVVAKEELERDLYSKFTAIINSKKEKIRNLKSSLEGKISNDYDKDEQKPGPSGTHNQKRPATTVDQSDEDHTTDDEGETQKSKKSRKADKSLDDDSLVLEEEKEEKHTVVARPKRSRDTNKKTTNSKPVLPKVSSKDSSNSIPDRPTSARKTRVSTGNTRGSTGNTCDQDPNAMIDDL